MTSTPSPRRCGLPEWIFYAVLPLMGVMMFLRTLIVMREDWRGENDITGEKE